MNGLNTIKSVKLCMVGSLDPNLVSRKVVLCECSSNAKVAKGAIILIARGVGIILANIEIHGEGLIANNHVMPTTIIGNDGG
jgi:hypothetical protein